MRTFTLTTLSLIAASTAVHAQDFFETQRAFRVDRDCVATPAPRLTADTTNVNAGQMFVARAVDRKANPQYVMIRIGEVSRWISLACGAFSDDDTSGKASVPRSNALKSPTG
jgi:hypothetical protein